MQLLRLEVNNWCQHRSRVCTFTRGLVAIIGKIGSGKSNLLGAICWLLTGENPNAGVKADNVSQLSSEEEPANATLEFEHGGHIIVITRHLLPEKEQATLFVDGVEAARGDKAVTAYVERILGIDSKFISRFVIVAQNEIFSFIEDGAAEVDKFFQKLFGTATAEKCQDIISKQLNKLIIPEVIESSAQLKLQLAGLDDKIDQFNEQIDALPSVEDFLTQQNAQQKLLQDWNAKEQLAGELRVAEQKALELDRQLGKVNEECASYAADVAALKDAIDGKQDAHTNAKVALGHLNTYHQLLKVKEKAARRLAEIVDLRSQQPEPAAVTDDERQAAINEQQRIAADITQAKKFIAAFAETNLANCPTCHTPTANLAEPLANAKNDLPRLEQEFAAAAQKVSSLTQALAQRQAWDKRMAELNAEEKQLVTSTQNLSSISVPAASEEELTRAVSDYENLQTALNELIPLAQTANERRANLSGAAEAINDQKHKLAEAIKNLTVTRAESELAQNTLNDLRQQLVRRQNLENEKTQLDIERARFIDKLTAAETDEQKAVTLRQWSDVAETARTALKSAPRLVAARNLQRLETAINELLQVFGVDFLVKAATDSSPAFIAEFFDGRKQPAKRLSYGQKTVLALAFRVAVNALFADEIGLLALDEPTAYLDQQRIKALAPVLEKLRELSTARGLQCLLVTHETSLSHLFESAVELDA